MTKLIGQLEERKVELSYKIEELQRRLNYETQIDIHRSFSPYMDSRDRHNYKLQNNCSLLKEEISLKRGQLQSIEFEIIRLKEEEKRKKIKLLILLV